MDLLFHTIAVEPARWTPQRTSQDLPGILPRIAAAGFQRIEVFEPHLTAATASNQIRDAFQANGLSFEILSSYLDLNPAATSADQVESRLDVIRERAEFYGFRRMRLFAGSKMKPTDKEAIPEFIKRLEHLVARLPGTEILLETHDGSLADDPETITQIVSDLKAPTVGLLYQPTFFEPEAALRQFEIQQPYIRHIHLQNRHADLSFAPLRLGVIPWQQIIPQLAAGVTATLEFVPAGICPVEEFDLTATLAEAQVEAAYARGLVG